MAPFFRTRCAYQINLNSENSALLFQIEWKMLKSNTELEIASNWVVVKRATHAKFWPLWFPYSHSFTEQEQVPQAGLHMWSAPSSLLNFILIDTRCRLCAARNSWFDQIWKFWRSNCSLPTPLRDKREICQRQWIYMVWCSVKNFTSIVSPESPLRSVNLPVDLWVIYMCSCR